MSDPETSTTGTVESPSMGPASTRTEDDVVSTGSGAVVESYAVTQISLCVPFSTVQYTSDGVQVKYCIRVSTISSKGAKVWQVDKRFSEIEVYYKELKTFLLQTMEVNGRVKKMFTKVPLPKLPSSSLVATTNSSLRAIQERRRQLDEFFIALSCGSILPSFYALREITLSFLKSVPVGSMPEMILPESSPVVRARACSEYSIFETQSVLSYFRVPADLCMPGKFRGKRTPSPPPQAVETASNGLSVSGSRVGSDSMLSPSTPRTPASASSVALGREKPSSSPPSLGTTALRNPGPGLIPHVVVTTPNTKMFFDTNDTLMVSLQSDRSEGRKTLKYRFNELLAFYKAFADNNDALMTTSDARKWFTNHRQTVAAERDSSSGSGASHGGLQNTSLTLTTLTPLQRESLPYSNGKNDMRTPPGANPHELFKGQPVTAVPKASSYAAKVKTMTSQRMLCHNSTHLVPNSLGGDGPINEDDLAPAPFCRCSDTAFCNVQKGLMASFVTSGGNSISIHPPIRTGSASPSPSSPPSSRASPQPQPLQA